MLVVKEELIALVFSQKAVSSHPDRDSYLIIQLICFEDYPDELNLLDVVTRPPYSNNLNLHHKKRGVLTSINSALSACHVLSFAL